MNFEAIIEKLVQFKIDEATRAFAHQEIAPYRNTLVSESTLAQAKKAAVLMMVHPKKKLAHFTLIQRASYKGVHSKQIALPGGKVEDSDLNILETAKREAMEEVNIKPTEVQIIGTMSPIYVPPSNFFITPVLAYSHQRPAYLAQEREVNHILEIPLKALIGITNVSHTKISLGTNKQIDTPFLNLQDHLVWGATAMILNELRCFLRGEKSP